MDSDTATAVGRLVFILAFGVGIGLVFHNFGAGLAASAAAALYASAHKNA